MKTTKLILNKEPVDSQNVIQRLTFNLLPNNTRLDTLEGRSHTVVPMVMLVEGVHEGSSGPLYYPWDELSKIPSVWNAKPVVVYHPEKDGQGISACDPVVMNTRKVGVIMNTVAEVKTKRLKAEAWLEQARADAVDARVFAAIATNNMMELSTGLFVDVEATAGEWKGEPYVGIARNFRPDHLALLPDKVGACSINDGAGFIRNQARAQGKGFLQATFNKLMERWGLVENEMSFDNIRQTLAAELRKKFNANQDKGPFLWVEDVYSNFCVYDFNNKLFRIGYSATDTGVTLSGDAPAEVKRVTEYRTVEGAFVGNRDQQQSNDMDKTKMIVAILAANCGWAEKDRPALESLSDGQLEVIHNGIKKPVVPAAPSQQPAPGAPPTSNDTPAPAAPLAPPAATPAAPVNNTPKPQTLQEYVASAPLEMQEVLRNGLDSFNREKATLVDAITKNTSNSFTKEELTVMPVEQLRKLATLAKQPTPSSTPGYYGMAPITENTQGLEEEALPLPTMNFAREKK